MPPQKSNKALHSIYQLKITLQRSKPPIWRRVLVPGNYSLEKLHWIIQVTMGWSGGHLHEFFIGGSSYGEPHPEYGEAVKNESKYTIKQAVGSKIQKFTYIYDFGDNWRHEIVVEKSFPPEEGGLYPVCIKGKRACPPEDVGGIWGYEEMIEALSNPEHEEHDSFLEWVDEDFDPETFDLDLINHRLKSFY